MCSKYTVCGKRHRYRRNKLGRFVQEERKLTKMFLGIVFLGATYMIGWNTIINSVGLAVQVDNVNAVETLTNEDFERIRIEHLINRVYEVAKEYKVSGYQMERTIECESRFNNIQSTAYQNGVREDSWGLAQIHLPSHPSVSREQAMDEEFAIEWMAKNFNNPYVTWYAYSRKYDRCN